MHFFGDDRHLYNYLTFSQAFIIHSLNFHPENVPDLSQFILLSRDDKNSSVLMFLSMELDITNSGHYLLQQKCWYKSWCCSYPYLRKQHKPNTAHVYKSTVSMIECIYTEHCETTLYYNVYF